MEAVTLHVTGRAEALPHDRHTAPAPVLFARAMPGFLPGTAFTSVHAAARDGTGACASLGERLLHETWPLPRVLWVARKPVKW